MKSLFYVFVFVIVFLLNINGRCFGENYNIVYVSRIVDPFIYGFALDDHILYYRDGNDLVLVDVSVPETPVERGRIQIFGSIGSVIINDGRAYVITSALGIQVIDISNPDAPIWIGFWQEPQYNKLYSLARFCLKP